MRNSVALAIAVALIICSQHTFADTLITQTGQRFEGRVIEEGERYLLISPSGGKMPFPKSMVREIIPSGEKTQDIVGPRESAGAEAEPTAAKEAKITLYMEIPIVGEFGKDVLPEGVELCLRYCSQNPNFKHIVFRINSPGGIVQAAQDIQALMKRYEGRFQYHAVIEKALSAAIWVVFACDTIHMADGSSVGAAVVFTPHATGAVQVDAKFNAAVAAQIASAAMSKGHPPVLAKAMIVYEAEAYAWSEAGKIVISEVRPKEVPPSGFLVNDTPSTVLALTKEQAVAVGLAKPLRGGPDGLGDSLGLAGWRKPSNYTENVMLQTKLNKEKADAEFAAAVKRNTERTKAVITYISSNAAEARDNDPGNFTYYYDPSSGMLTAESSRLWQRQTDITMAAWRRVQSGTTELLKLEKEAEKLGMQRTIRDLNLADLYNRAEREISRLLAERRRLTP